MAEELKKTGVRQTPGRQYQGPTSILNSVSAGLQDEGISTVTIMAHMPSHLSLQEPDYTGVYSVLSVIAKLEHIEIPLERIRSAGKRQYDRINREVTQSPSLINLSKELEEIYDRDEEKAEDDIIPLPPSIQKAIDEALGKE